MPGRIIEIGTPGTQLSILHSQLLVKRPDMVEVRIPFEDLEALIIDDPSAQYSHRVFTLAAESGTTVVLCNSKHQPDCIVLPLSDHHRTSERHSTQISLGAVPKKRIWQKLIRCKIERQADILDLHAAGGDALRSMARRVASGDPDNLEAQAAQRYWVNLFGPTFRRDRDAEGINAVLNYGYAVIRASIARNIVASGLLPSLGVHHSNRGNPFCLADDLIEPYRPLVDKVVAGLDRQDSTMDLADRDVRSSILAILNKTTTINGRRVPVFLALRSTCLSLYSAFNSSDSLVLPETLQSDDEPDDYVDTEWVARDVDRSHVRHPDADPRNA